MDLDIFLFKLEMWYFQLKDESIITPRYLINCFSSIVFILILIVIYFFNVLL